MTKNTIPYTTPRHLIDNSGGAFSNNLQDQIRRGLWKGCTVDGEPAVMMLGDGKPIVHVGIQPRKPYTRNDSEEDYKKIPYLKPRAFLKVAKGFSKWLYDQLDEGRWDGVKVGDAPAMLWLHDGTALIHVGARPLAHGNTKAVALSD